jgi:hypothetical protein
VRRKRLLTCIEGLRAADTDDEVAAAWIAVDLLRRDVPGARPRHRPPPPRDLLRVGRRRDVAEITALASTIDTWQHEVLAFFDTHAFNATESET